MFMVKNQQKIMARQIQTPFFQSGLIDSQMISINVQSLKAVLDVIEDNL